ncbi:glycosyltransferase family 4 protein [Vibrio rarus]|uniref:glycosyltransferase family 4 protein n=1 Tax=Vibrio rarus TaxID=413403 RepID=UPI0021C43507|nr:glycosyltransferase family 4 protein [Vibrio rarus]
MKTIFAHDHRFIVNSDNNVYSKGKVKREMFDLYLNHSDLITVVSRFEQTELSTIECDNKFNGINNEVINFIGFKNLSNPIELFSNNLSSMCEIIADYDFVIARLPSEIGLLAVKSAKKLGIPYAIEFVACPWDALYHYGRLEAKLYAPVFYYRNRKAVLDCPNVVYVTSSFLQSRYPTNGNSFGVSDVEIDCDTKVHHIKEFTPSKRISLGLIGSLDSPHKGISDALKALRLLLDKGYDVELNVLGPGDNLRWANSIKGIESRVRFLGTKKPGKEVQDWLASLDIYIQPSLQEGLPRSIVEAMNCGLPIVASNAGGIPELIQKNFIHRKKDYTTLAKMIEKLFNSYEYRQSSKFSIETSEQFDYRELFSKRSHIWKSILTK